MCPGQTRDVGNRCERHDGSMPYVRILALVGLKTFKYPIALAKGNQALRRGTVLHLIVALFYRLPEPFQTKELGFGICRLDEFEIVLIIPHQLSVSENSCCLMDDQWLGIFQQS